MPRNKSGACFDRPRALSPQCTSQCLLSDSAILHVWYAKLTIFFLQVTNLVVFEKERVSTVYFQLIFTIFMALHDENLSIIRSFHSSTLLSGVLPQCKTSIFLLVVCEPKIHAQV